MITLSQLSKIVFSVWVVVAYFLFLHIDGTLRIPKATLTITLMQLVIYAGVVIGLAVVENKKKEKIRC